MTRATSIAMASLIAVFAAVAGCNAAMPPMAPDAMLLEPGPSPPPTGTSVSGQWMGVGHGATGSVRYGVESGVARLDFSDDFTVSAVPGPFVYVNTTNNANAGRPLRVAALRSNSGPQSYAFQIPAGETYAWVLVWCDPFNVPVAEARVTPAP